MGSLVVNIYWNEDFIASKYAFDTTRKSKHVADSLKSNKIKGIKLADPYKSKHTDNEDIDRLIDVSHSSEYIDALRTGSPRSLAETQGFDWDKEMYKMASAHTHGMVASVKEVMANGGRSGSLSSGLHHADDTMGSGFCTINGVAMSAFAVVEAQRKALILDFDAHCGGGTARHIAKFKSKYGKDLGNSIIQVDVSVSAFDMWDPSILDKSKLILSDAFGVSSDHIYLSDIDQALEYASSVYTDDMVVIYNAGVDPANVSMQITDKTIAQREKLVSEWIGDKPAIFSLAGGYTWGKTMDEVVNMHRHVISEWAE